MKQLFFIFVFCIQIFFLSANTNAQSLRVDSIIGWPEIVTDSQAVTMSILISNGGGTVFMGDLAILMNIPANDSTPDTLYYNPADTVMGNSFYDTITVTHTFYAADMDAGDNIVVVWPSSSQSAVVHDSLYLHLIFNNIGIYENERILSLQLYPNPSGGNIHLRIAHAEKVEQVRVLDILGKEIFSFGEAVSSINVASLVEGIYFVEVKDRDGGLVVKKFFRK
jgi:hypothetical protein